MGKQFQEQPLPPYGACLLGSFNLVKYIYSSANLLKSHAWKFDYEQFRKDIPVVVRAMDNVVDRAIYPLPQQSEEARNKRRMGLGVTGVANAIERLGFPYGSPEFLSTLERILTILRDEAYKASIELAKEKGAFPLFDVKLLESEFAKTLPENIREDIRRYGLRNSHLLSIAPTGTISLTADNVSSGIEPVYLHELERRVGTPDGPKHFILKDYAYEKWGIKGKTTEELSVDAHVKVLTLASRYVDSACSKTCNVGDEVSWDEFKKVYMDAYEGGASGCTTFRASGKRFGIFKPVSESETNVSEPGDELSSSFADERAPEGTACYYDPATGQRSCE